jgi:hypothetical protein
MPAGLWTARSHESVSSRNDPKMLTSNMDNINSWYRSAMGCPNVLDDRVERWCMW